MIFNIEEGILVKTLEEIQSNHNLRVLYRKLVLKSFKPAIIFVTISVTYGTIFFLASNNSLDVDRFLKVYLKTTTILLHRSVNFHDGCATASEKWRNIIS